MKLTFDVTPHQAAIILYELGSTLRNTYGVDYENIEDSHRLELLTSVRDTIPQLMNGMNGDNMKTVLNYASKIADKVQNAIDYLTNKPKED